MLFVAFREVYTPAPLYSVANDSVTFSKHFSCSCNNTVLMLSGELKIRGWTQNVDSGRAVDDLINSNPKYKDKMQKAYEG